MASPPAEIRRIPTAAEQYNPAGATTRAGTERREIARWSSTELQGTAHLYFSSARESRQRLGKFCPIMVESRAVRSRPGEIDSLDIR